MNNDNPIFIGDERAARLFLFAVIATPTLIAICWLFG